MPFWKPKKKKKAVHKAKPAKSLPKYDWSDLELSLSDIEALIGMAKS